MGRVLIIGCGGVASVAIHKCCQNSHWRRTWQLTPVLLPGKSHGQRSLVGYSPWGHQESDMTERLSMHTHTALHSESEKIDLIKNK